jgi:hypothetical protein
MPIVSRTLDIKYDKTAVGTLAPGSFVLSCKETQTISSPLAKDRNRNIAEQPIAS